MKKRTKDTKKEIYSWCCGCGRGWFWGITFLVWGLWILFRDLGYISSRVSFWPIALILLGLWILFKKRN